MHIVLSTYDYIAGPPSAPIIEFTQSHLIDGFIHSRLYWSAPFTQSGYPITNYTVTIFNHSNEETTTVVRTANFADYAHQSLSQGDHCYELDFTVVASNRVGRSPPATVHTGHPIGIKLYHKLVIYYNTRCIYSTRGD